MSGAYDWSWLRAGKPQVDLDEYVSMPEDLCRLIEVKDGLAVYCESGSPNHISIARAIEQAMRNAARKRAAHEPCLRASGDVDMLITEVPFSFRKPDVILYHCIGEPRGKWKTKPTAADTLLVVEVVSPSTVTVDCVDKRAEYARLGIDQYWIVRMENNDGRVKSIEMLELNTDGSYVTVRKCMRSRDPLNAVSVSDPLELTITWEELDADIE
jgi:Uma2 family endonuclease